MFKHPYIPFLWRVERPGRYIGGEYGAVIPSDDARVRIALAFPDAYEIGMSHMGISILYEIINQMDHISAERVYMPWPDMEALLREHQVPLVSLESATPLREFDVVGFSLQYELTYTNLIAMLDMGGIPRRSVDRTEAHPLVLTGGPVAIQAEPLAPFVDLVLVGDGEEALPSFLQQIEQCKLNRMSRGQTIAALAELPNVYAPGLLERNYDEQSQRMVVKGTTPAAQVAAVKELEKYPPGYGPVPMIQAVFDRFSVEIARGCTEGCRFCQAGFLYRPVRERSKEAARTAVERAVSCLGFDEASLAALSSADHSQIDEIVTGLGDEYTKKRVSLSVPSLRAYGLSDELVEVLARLRATGVTLAPEAGSQRLRDVVNKNITEDDLMNAAARFFDHGFSRIKLYFMLGLPSETDDDLEEIVHLAVRLRSLGRRRLGRKKVDIVVSVSTFVPKPFTPFERETMISQDEIRRRQHIIFDLARRHRIEVRTHDVRLSWLEGIFCRGDYTLADILEKAVDSGARYDGWGDMFNEKAWERALEGVSTDHFFKGLPSEARLPWDHVQVGVSEAFRRKQREAAQSAKLTKPCGRFVSDQSNGPIFVCHACGLKCAPGEVPLRKRRQTTSPVEDTPPPVRTKQYPKPKPVVQASDREPIKFRMKVAVWGRQTFIGHLDTMRHLMRSFRRAGLEVFYTQGFHPKPKIEASPPLPLGTAGLAEPLDVWLLDPPSPEDMLERLNEAVPPDLEITSIRQLTPEESKLAKTYNGATYVAFVNGDPQDAQKAVSEILSADSIQVERVRKRKTSVIDIKPFIADVEVTAAVPGDYRLPSDSRRVAIRFTLKVPGSGGTKPIEVLKPFLPSAADDPWVVRTAWIKLD